MRMRVHTGEAQPRVRQAGRRGGRERPHARGRLLRRHAAAAAGEAFLTKGGVPIVGDPFARIEALATAVNAYCLLQLGYAYAGSGGSSVNEHWQHAAAANRSGTHAGSSSFA